MLRSSRSRSAPRQNTLSTIPEELLERILALCIDTPEPASSSYVSGASGAHRTAPLLVCKRFLRIATPLFYHTLTLRTPRQTHRLCHTLTANPLLGSFARKLVVQSADVHDVSYHILALCRGIEELDISLVDGGVGNAEADEAHIRRFCKALARLDRIRSLTLRKPASTYLTHDRPRLLLEGLADAVKYWRNLQVLTFAFRLSSTPSTDLLVSSLSRAPRLHTVRAVMPTVLNACFITLSTNPALRNIELITDETPSGVIFGTGNGLFLKDARKHERLWTCIRRGTPTVRARANTYSTSPSPPASSSSVQQIKPTQSMGSLAPPSYNYSHNRSAYGHPPAAPSSGKGRCPPPPPPSSASAQYAAAYYYTSSGGHQGYYQAYPESSSAAGYAREAGYRASSSTVSAGGRRGTR